MHTLRGHMRVDIRDLVKGLAIRTGHTSHRRRLFNNSVDIRFISQNRRRNAIRISPLKTTA